MRVRTPVAPEHLFDEGAITLETDAIQRGVHQIDPRDARSVHGQHMPRQRRAGQRCLQPRDQAAEMEREATREPAPCGDMAAGHEHADDFESVHTLSLPEVLTLTVDQALS